MRKFILQAMLKFDNAASGNVAANVEFNVYNAGGGLANIYANDGANQISQASPLLTDSNGRYEFYVDNGRYSIIFTDPVIASQNNLTDLGIYEYGSAGARDAATTAEAIAGTSDKLPDTIGVKAFVDTRLPKPAVKHYYTKESVTVNFDDAQRHIITRFGSPDATITLTGTLTAGDELVIENVRDDSGVVTITGRTMYTGIGVESDTTHTLTGQAKLTMRVFNPSGLMVTEVV